MNLKRLFYWSLIFDKPWSDGCFYGYLTQFISVPDKHLASSHILREHEEREENRKDAQQQGKWVGDGGRGGAHSVADEADEAGLVAGDLAFDPVLVLRHTGVDPREVGLSTARSKTHHSTQDPLGGVLTHQGAAWIPLHRSHEIVRGSVCRI